jgi:hypothetical protein
MNMLEALKTIKENEEKRTADQSYSHAHVWARPISWRDWPYPLAYCYRKETSFAAEGFELVPNARGGSQAVFPRTNELFIEWEVLTPNQVYGEKNANSNH